MIAARSVSPNHWLFKGTRSKVLPQNQHSFQLPVWKAELYFLEYTSGINLICILYLQQSLHFWILAVHQAQTAVSNVMYQPVG